MSNNFVNGGAAPPESPRRCTATAKGTGERCERWAMRGATVCPFHGGKAPQVQAAARRRLVAEEAAKKLRELEYEPIADPLTELGDITGRAKALMTWFEARAGEAKDGLEAEVALSLYVAAADRTARLLETCARLGIEDRRVQLEEAQATIVFEALVLAIGDAGLNDHKQALCAAWSQRVVEVEASYAAD